MNETVASNDALSLITAGWEQLATGKWRHPRMIQRGRCRPLPLDAAVAAEAALRSDHGPAIVPWCGIEGDPED